MNWLAKHVPYLLEVDSLIIEKTLENLFKFWDSFQLSYNQPNYKYTVLDEVLNLHKVYTCRGI